MFSDAFLLQAPIGLFDDTSLCLIARAIALLLLGVALLVLFQPLLSGMARALLLLFKPRLSREQRQARQLMRDAALLRSLIADSSGPDDASELRAIAARA